MGEQPNRHDESHAEEHETFKDLFVHQHDLIRELQRRVRELEQHAHRHEVQNGTNRRGFRRGRRQ